jgi:hypothetical protein
MFALIEKVPAGTRTTVLLGAELRAELMLAAVTVPPNSVLQAAVAQLAQLALGMPPGIPVLLVQSTARAGERIPDHACPYESEENKNNSTTSKNGGVARLMSL